MSSCRFAGWIEPYVDGELIPEHTVEFEDHLPNCPTCRAELDGERVYRRSVADCVREELVLRPEFVERLSRQLAEVSRERVCRRRGARASGIPESALTVRSILPLSVAAAAALVFAQVESSNHRSEARDVIEVERASVTRAGSGEHRDTLASVESFLDDLTEAYKNPEVVELGADQDPLSEREAVEVAEPSPVRAAKLAGLPAQAEGRDGKTGRRAAPRPELSSEELGALFDDRDPSKLKIFIEPPELSSLGAVWEGGQRRHSRHQGQLTSWYYRVGEHRVVVSAYDSRRVPLRVLLEPRVARNKPVFVGTRGGYAVAAFDHQGIGLAATADLSPHETAELVAAAVH